MVGSGGQTKFYVDGNYVGIVPSQVIEDLNAIGGNEDYQNVGIMDEAAVFDVAMTEDQIKAMYNTAINGAGYVGDGLGDACDNCPLIANGDRQLRSCFKFRPIK
jgi:hypothetical protein